MFDMIEKLLERLRIIWDGMSLNQRVVSGTALVAFLIAALYLSTLSDRIQDYTVLYAQLDATSANDIMARLDQENVPYRLTRNGTAIEVPTSFADRLKIELAAEGLPESGIVGYEILDTTNFGMSDFLQKVNYKRALEGELRRTLQTLDEVTDAKVHLVIPEPSLYRESEQPPTASVVLSLRSGRSLPPAKVEAIASLIASAAVEGLDPANVTIIDSKGNQLSKPFMDELAMQSSTVLDLKFAYEQRLASRVKDMIDGAFGAGTALVMVNADIDFDRINRETVSYNQNGSAIASEFREEVTNPTADGGGEERATTNYETGHIVENLINTPGSNVNRLTVSVMVDGKETRNTADDGTVQIEKLPWSDQELTSIRAISETAVGFDQVRGDRIEVVYMPFGGQEPEEAQGGIAIQAALIEGLGAISTGVAIIVGLMLFLAIVRSIVRALDPERMRVEVVEKFEKEMPAEMEAEAVALSERSQLIKRIMEQVAKEPELTAKAIKSIYREDA